MTTKTHPLPLLNHTKKPNERHDLLKFLTPVMVVINYLTMMLVIVVIWLINCDFLRFRALINITKDDNRSLFITRPFIHQMAPSYIALLMYADYVIMLRIK